MGGPSYSVTVLALKKPLGKAHTKADWFYMIRGYYIHLSPQHIEAAVLCLWWTGCPMVSIPSLGPFPVPARDADDLLSSGVFCLSVALSFLKFIFLTF